MKKSLRIITDILLLIFSFIYTKKAIIFLKYHDPLMQELISKQNIYYKNYQNAIITNHYIIPGIKGKKINLNKSYNKMKKINSFNESLLVYDDIKPNISLTNHYDKLVLKGNLSKRQISIIIDLKNQSDISNINNYLKNNNIFLDIYSNNYININNTNFKNIISNNYYFFTNFCLYINKINNNCLNNNIYTINTYNIKSLQDIKTNLNNGIIYLYHYNNLEDLKLIIKYIINNNYQIVSIDKLLSE